MPIMQTCAQPEKFTKILTYAIFTLCLIFVAFGNLCYFTYGGNMNAPIITEMLPPQDKTVIATKLLFIVNLLCSYAICIYPTNTIIESWLFDRSNKSKTVYWLQNLSRTCVIILAAFLGVALADRIDKFLGLMGALLCAPLALMIPSLVHLKLLATTKN